jgi:hypothetical protein
MSKVSRLAAIVVGLFFVAGVGSAITIADINEDDLSGCGVGCYIIGDKKFTSIALTDVDPNPGSTTPQFTDANVDVTGWQTGGIVYIQFNLPAYALSGAEQDFVLSYTVETVSGQPWIYAIDQYIVGTAGLSPGGGPDPQGIVSVAESVLDATGTDVIAWSNVTIVGDPVDPVGEVNDQLILDGGPVSKALVTKDVFLRGGTMNGSLGESNLTLLRQSFHQLPEPGFYGMLTLGLSGLYLANRRRRKV